ncbi:MAG: ATP-binding protein, partial [Planctomycetaceae bacterium]|nr:ATP-binding protein [Planctomycetaceae bacterium]
MIQKQFDSISKDEIDALLANGVTESKTLEYKQELPGNSDREKKEFLADVSSFANASGGDILFGIVAEVDKHGKKTGAPETVLPITDTTPDGVKLRLEEIIRNGIEPRLRVQIQEITGWGDDEVGFIILI